MSAGADWSRLEVEATVGVYFEMLEMELRGESFNKAERNRRLRGMLQDRSRGSIEWKHQNISAVLVELGYPYVEGYKPRYNYQELLRRVVAERLTGAAEIEELVQMVVDAPAGRLVLPDDLLSIQVAAPKADTDERGSSVRETPTSAFGTARNYLEIEARNRSLGLAGEEMVLRFEHERLWKAGERKLADRIEHVSATRGDQMGYDVLSFEADGRERLIEVKTTRFGSLTPFFASRNEVAVSEARYTDYQLFRVFKFGERPQLFTLPGSLRKSCRLDPVQFAAVPA